MFAQMTARHARAGILLVMSSLGLFAASTASGSPAEMPAIRVSPPAEPLSLLGDIRDVYEAILSCEGAFPKQSDPARGICLRSVAEYCEGHLSKGLCEKIFAEAGEPYPLD